MMMIFAAAASVEFLKLHKLTLSGEYCFKYFLPVRINTVVNVIKKIKKVFINTPCKSIP